MTDSSSTAPPEQLSLAPIVQHPIDVSGVTQRIKDVYMLARGKPDVELVQVINVVGTPPSSLTVQKIGTSIAITGVVLVGWAGAQYPTIGEYIWIFTPFPGATPCALGMPAPVQPRCRVHSSGGSLANNGFPGNAIGFDSGWAEDYKELVSHSAVTNNSRLTIQRGGIYTIDASISWAANGNGLRATSLAFNGAIFKTEIERQADAIFGNTVSIHLDMELNANDYVELYYVQNSGAALGITAGTAFTYLSIVKIADRA